MIHLRKYIPFLCVFYIHAESAGVWIAHKVTWEVKGNQYMILLGKLKNINNNSNF